LNHPDEVSFDLGEAEATPLRATPVGTVQLALADEHERTAREGKQ